MVTVAVSKADKDNLLGYICWFSCPSEPVKITKLRKEWLLAGLDPHALPKETRTVSLFQRSVRAQQGKVVDAEGNTVQTDVKDVMNTEEECVYQVSRVVRDRDEKIVEYPKALRAIFVRKTEEIKFKPLGGVSRADALGMMEGVQGYFDTHSKSVTGHKVRGLVRRYLTHDSSESIGVAGLGGENLRGQSGGVYFVLAEHGEELEALSQVLEELYPHKAFLHAVPLQDGDAGREIIRRHHIDGTVEEIKQEIAAVSGILREGRGRAVKSDVVALHRARLEALRRRAHSYGRALDEESEDVQTALELLSGQLARL